MSDKWEVVVGSNKPKKVRPANGQVNSINPQPQSTQLTSKTQKPPKKKKHIGPRDSKVAKLPGTDDEYEENNISNVKVEALPKPKKTMQKQAPTKPKEKAKDLESALRNVSPEELKLFYVKLSRARSEQPDVEVFLSWIKYSADALDTKLNQIPPPDPNHWPNDLYFPKISKDMESVIHYIILQTAGSQENIDLIGLSFSSILASIPAILLKGGSCWGSLLFLREMCKIDPELAERRAKTLSEIMESYGNRKEVGTCLLWVAAQASLRSDHVIKIVSEHILPFYTFKNYKAFVLSALSTIASSAVMSGDNIVGPLEFDEFFETCFDPKKRKDFENFYLQVRNLALRNLRDHGDVLFFKFLAKVGDKTFMPLSAYGQEVFEVLHGCLSRDASIIDKWRSRFGKYSKESTILLNNLAKRPGVVPYWKKLESDLIQTDEFASSSVQTPDLIRIAKKLQTGFKKAEASKKRFTWKMACFIILLMISGIFYLDVTENGNGTFAKSQTGKLLESVGLLDETQLVIDTTKHYGKIGMDISSTVIQNVYEGIRPLLQTVEKQAETYIPEVLNYGRAAGNYTYDTSTAALTYLQKNVFVGKLSPESVRKSAKDGLTLIWTNVNYGVNKAYGFIDDYFKESKVKKD